MIPEKKHGNIIMIVALLLIVNILLTVYIGFFKKDAYWLETLKVGGAENMKLATQLYTADAYKQQQKITLDQILASMGQNQGTTQPETTTQDTITTTSSSSDKEKFAAIVQNGYIFGNKNTRITIIEYSDMLCPFCKRHYNAQTIENLVKKYPNDVNMIFRQMPLPQLHPTAPIGAQGAICVGKLAGSHKFYAYLAEAFKLNDFTEKNVTDIATKLGVNKSKFVTCLTSQETIDQVNAEVQEGQSFGINGTPGNLIVDNEKGTFVLIAGAYPIEKFEAEIKKILGK